MKNRAGILEQDGKRNLFSIFGGLRIEEWFWLLAINGLLFESCLSREFSLAGYLDETLTIVLFGCALFVAVRDVGGDGKTLLVWDRFSILFLAILIGLGLLSGFSSGIQPNPKPVLVDIFACSKFVVALLSSYIVLRRGDGILNALFVESKILLLIMIPFAIVNQFVDMGMRYDIRYGLYSFQLLFGHPGSFAAVMACLVVLFSVDPKKNMLWAILCWLYLCLSLRSIAIAFAVFSALMWIAFYRNGRISAGKMSVFAVVALCLGWGQIQYYFFEIDKSARSELLNVAIQIADKYFPLGSGFATYASNVTGQADYYSPLYYQYGLSDVYGLTPSDTSFLSDSFWPIVIGQFGWFGAVCFVCLLICLLLGCYRRLQEGAGNMLPVLMAFSYLLVSSVGSSAFFHPSSVLMAICISLAVSYRCCYRGSNEVQV